MDLVARHGPPGPPPQIVWLTCGDTTNAARRGVLAGTWPRIAQLLAAAGALVESSGRALYTVP